MSNKNDGEDVTEEEQRQYAEMDQQISNLDKKMQKIKSISDKYSMNLTLPDQGAPYQQPNNANMENIPTIDSRGNIILDNNKIHENYNNQFPILKYLELPYCKRSIYSKCQFWGAMSLAIAYFFEAKYSIESKQGLKGIRFKPFMKKYFFFTALGCGFSLVESIWFEDYCDINSYHYANDINRRKILEEIKNKYKNR